MKSHAELRSISSYTYVISFYMSEYLHVFMYIQWCIYIYTCVCVSFISYLPCSETCRWALVKQEWMRISGMNRQGIAGSKFLTKR